MVTQIKAHYGPLDLKEATLNVDPDQLLTKYTALAKNTSDQQYFYLINQLVGEFHDSHFSSRVATNHISTLGFVTDLVEGKVVVDQVFRALLPQSEFSFDRGDELVAIDGKPVADIVKDLGRYFGMGYDDANARIATMYVAYRTSAVEPPQTGQVNVTMRSATTQQEATLSLEWKQLGDPINDGVRPAHRLAAPTHYNLISIKDVLEPLPQTEASYRCSPKTRIAIPTDATVLMMEPFVAYYHPTAKGNVGYLRIPHYEWVNTNTQADENELRFTQYEWAINQFEKNTVGLIIDQDHNCGGDVGLVEKMVSLFVDKPFPGLQFKFLATRSEYLEFKNMVAGTDPHTLDGAGLAGVLDLMTASWLKGDRMTDITTFHGAEPIYPNAVRYSKPVVMLIDEMSGSGGDAFPALMQGLGRAKLLGNHTMGAGGHVEPIAALSYSGNNINMTKSLFFRPDGKPIENRGALPDYPYLTTRADFMNGYRDYQKFYEQKLAELIP